MVKKRTGEAPVGRNHATACGWQETRLAGVDANSLGLACHHSHGCLSIVIGRCFDHLVDEFWTFERQHLEALGGVLGGKGVQVGGCMWFAEKMASITVAALVWM